MSLALALGFLPMAGFSGCDTKEAVKAAPIVSPAATAPAIEPAVAPTPPPPPQPTAQERRVQQLITQAEQALANGQAHYRKGQLARAKTDFDSAVDMMLSSGLDIKADAQLNDEFNKILDAVNSLEMEALKQGNGFAPKVEPAPADVANDVTFEVDPNLIAKAKEELATTRSDLPLVINQYVGGYINFFANTQKGHNTLLHSFQRAGRYKGMIQRVLKEEGVPQDLIYLAVAESGFQPQAVNGHSGAGGMWQFMPHGDYGLARNSYVDERFDPEKSTRAYARYMKFLYNQLGDWYLAMAAYDWGAGSIQRAVQKTGYADFWELYKRNNLPVETKNYVPEILAAIIIANNPKQYGFEDLPSDPPIVTETVPIDYAVDLRLVADLVDADPQEITALNPGVLRLTTPPAGILAGPFDLHLPPGTGSVFRQNISAIPEDKRTHWRYHRVTPDDTLTSVARGYRVTVDQLASANQLHPGDTLQNVEALVVPVAPPAAPATRTETYRARRGDSLVKIADRFGVSLDDLHRWNHTTGVSVTAGQRVRVAEPSKGAPQNRSAAHDATAASASSHTSNHTSNHTTSHATTHVSAAPKTAKKPGSSAKSSTKAPAKTASAKTNATSSAKPGSHSQSKSAGTEEIHKSAKKKNIQK
jgi:membrane-bound lytic murein transglycosylase D